MVINIIMEGQITHQNWFELVWIGLYWFDLALNGLPMGAPRVPLPWDPLGHKNSPPMGSRGLPWVPSHVIPWAPKGPLLWGPLGSQGYPPMGSLGLPVPGLGLTTSNPAIQGSRYLGLGTWAGADDEKCRNSGLQVPGLRYLG